MSNDLRECPFCGGEAYRPNEGPEVCCKSCSGWNEFECNWNARAADERIAALEGELIGARQTVMYMLRLESNAQLCGRLIQTIEDIDRTLAAQQNAEQTGDAS